MGNTINDALIAWYGFDDENEIGKDKCGLYHASVEGIQKPQIMEVAGRKALRLFGGDHGNSYLKLPNGILEKVSDDTGMTVAAWVYFDKGKNVWERLFDFGKGTTGPYLFLTRNLRGVCFAGDDLFADPGKSYPQNEWVHIAMTLTATKRGSMSSAGPRIYVNGELAADGMISQTSSGTYKKLREWFSTFDGENQYSNNYIGHSQYEADGDFEGALSDFRIYHSALDESEILGIMCESLSNQEIVNLAVNKFLPFIPDIVTDHLLLPSTLMDGSVSVRWESDRPDVLRSDGMIDVITEASRVCLKAVVEKKESSAEKVYLLSAVPKEIPPYELTIHAERDVLDISDVLYGLFYEDINNAADGGIYAELVSNRSFEAFTYDTYDHRSGKDAKSTGRVHTPLMFWHGDVDDVEPRYEGGLNEHFKMKEQDVNACYVTVKDGAILSNRGFSDTTGNFAMRFRKGADYTFSIWARREYEYQESAIKVYLNDVDGNRISTVKEIKLVQVTEWMKYQDIILTADADCFGELVLAFDGEISIDMVSLMPVDVWGYQKEEQSATACDNYKANPNYRLRRDLVESLIGMHPKFLRFPGGCISEGSYIWDNVYDWKDSVGDVEIRKENFNVWGYMMSMGLGYMEYFQLAEDLNAVPLPVMACGVLCQARSDYANPAGGTLQEKYIKNFTDLIDFAISMDFEQNEWAALRKKMGHEAPFNLHYLGVGNENWGDEFFASFQMFKYRIDQHMERYYPGYELHIISTVGAQADDDAYQQGWRFLYGDMNGKALVEFTDGTNSFEEEVTWYAHQNNYMETIADEHYYRSNAYLLENADRYNYYDRPDSKVFVGEYASSDKNTLAGAVAEAAVMTGFENNADVVRLAAYAPLFNKVLSDGTYRWTPDAIWFDDESVWHTPNYYVQQMFAGNIGEKLVDTSFKMYMQDEKKSLIPRGGISIETRNAEILVHEMKVVSNKDGSILFEQDFTKELKSEWKVLDGAVGYTKIPQKGILLKAQESGRNGIYLDAPDWTDYTISVKAVKQSGTDGFYIGTGIESIHQGEERMHLFTIGESGQTTGIKVYKDGKQGYTMGDYSSSTVAGNLRACTHEAIRLHEEYEIKVDFGGESGEELICSYQGDSTKKTMLSYKLKAYNRAVFHSVTKDEKRLYTKLVNADDFDKTLSIRVEDAKVKEEADIITLSGEAALLHVPNVNQKGNEQIVPVLSKATIKNNNLEIVLPANSVTVAVFELRES